MFVFSYTESQKVLHMSFPSPEERSVCLKLTSTGLPMW